MKQVVISILREVLAIWTASVAQGPDRRRPCTASISQVSVSYQADQISCCRVRWSEFGGDPRKGQEMGKCFQGGGRHHLQLEGKEAQENNDCSRMSPAMLWTGRKVQRKYRRVSYKGDTRVVHSSGQSNHGGWESPPAAGCNLRCGCLMPECVATADHFLVNVTKAFSEEPSWKVYDGNQ